MKPAQPFRRRLSRRRRHHLYRAQAGACLRAAHSPLGSTRRGRAHRLAGCGDRLHAGIDWAGSSLALAQTPRAAAANKGNFGHVLVVGGTFGSAGGKAGAPAMTALAALRAGAGLVTAAVPAPALPVVASFAAGLDDVAARSPQTPARLPPRISMPERVAALTEGKTVLAIGPGLGQSAETAKFAIGIAFRDQHSRRH